MVDAASRDSIEALGRELKEKTGAELAVVTLADLGGDGIEAVAVDLFQAWGIGRKGRDDGVLILQASSERRVRIEVGYGLEGILPDGLCGFIVRRVMAPDLAADRFGPGLLRGADAVAGVIARDRGATLAPGRGAPLPRSRSMDRGPALAVMLVVFLAIVVIAVILNRLTPHGGWGDWPGRRRYRGPFWGGGFGGLGGGFGGGLGGGLGGGGFGGFGGGRSGGGGASGGF